ncbi:Non-repetitive/WGA-negative nucleoporin C-terminal-domain-containing protein [Syncephalis fuscata]|nr:Non-repetitive/WGA-negative nucleoporin C-terminal-domain-containing protein [Syncephalis fuscata]
MFTTTAPKSTTRRVTRSRSVARTGSLPGSSDGDDDAAASLRSPTRHRTKRVLVDLTTASTMTDQTTLDSSMPSLEEQARSSSPEMTTPSLASSVQTRHYPSNTAFSTTTITSSLSRPLSPSHIDMPMSMSSADMKAYQHLQDGDDIEDISLSVEEKLQQYLLKSDQCSISVLGPLPLKVKEFLSVSDLNSDSFRVIIDSQSEYAALVALRQCYVWSFRQTGSGTPTCIGFTLPTGQSETSNSTRGLYNDTAIETLDYEEDIEEDEDKDEEGLDEALPDINTKKMVMSTRLPVVCFVPNGTHREPGLLCCSAYGHVRYWERVSYGIAGVDRNQQLRMHLSNSDWVVDMQSCRVALSFAPLSRSMNMLARMSRRIKDMVTGSFEMTHELALSPVSVITPGARDDKHGVRYMIFLSATSLQKWQLYQQRPEKFVHEQDIYERVRDHIFSDQDSGMNHPDDLHVRLLDAQYAIDGSVAVLVSYRQSVHQQQQSNRNINTVAPTRSFCIAIFDTQSGSGSEELFLIDRIDLNYTAYDDPRPNTRPQLLLPSGNRTAVYIVFPDALVIASLLPGSSFQEAISLKHTHQDRILGAGCQREWRKSERDNNVNRNGVSSQMVMVCASTGLLLVQVDTARIQKEAHLGASRLNTSLFMPNEQVLETLHLKSRIEQAIFFGAFNQNPLSFILSDKVKGNLDMAVLDVNEEILTSASKYVNTSLDMRQQLAERLECTTSIMHFMNSSGLQNKLELLTRYKLCWSAEKLSSAIDLWHYYNQQLSRSTSKKSNSILLEAIISLGKELNIMTKAIKNRMDPVRPSSNIILLYHVQRQQQLMKQNEKLSPHSTDYYHCVIQVDRMIQLVIQASYTYRKEMGSIYGLNDTLPPLPSWTETEDRISLIQTQCETIIECLNGMGQDAVLNQTLNIEEMMDTDKKDALIPIGINTALDTPVSMASTLLYQLCLLSNMLFRTFTDRLTWLSSRSTDDQDKEKLELRYKELQLRIIKPLVTFGQLDQAIHIAEQYRNFKLLIKLLFTYQERDDVIKGRIPHYLSIYGDDFGFALFTYYIETHNRRLLLEMPDQYNAMLKRFLDQYQYDDLAWIHDLRLRLFNEASKKLIQSTGHATSVNWQKIMLSIGKLSYMASLTTFQLDEPQVQVEIAKFDEQLDRVEMQERLQSLLTSTRQMALSNKATLIREKQADSKFCTSRFATWMEKWISHLLLGEPLDIDDFVEYISLKQASSEYELEDMGRALTILPNAHQLTETRLNAALRTLWRRILLKDNWTKMKREMVRWSDEELMVQLSKTALYHVLRFAQGSGAFDHTTSYLLLPHEMYWSTSKIDMELRFTENLQLEQLIGDEAFTRFYNEIIREEEEEEEDDEHNEAMILVRSTSIVSVEDNSMASFEEDTEGMVTDD